ncbi:MAG TPA: AAA family ATPase [Thermoanaerobaculia bacterium]|nr:AAA family ATPase [Thermoanaerobaculia bacterium]
MSVELTPGIQGAPNRFGAAPASIQGNGSRPIERFLTALQTPPKKAGAGQWKARCPAHDDKTPSLSIGEGDEGRLLLYCFAGCPNDAVVRAVGLSWADLSSPDTGLYHYLPTQRKRGKKGWEVFEGGSWRTSDGDVSLKELPLYRGDEVASADPKTPVLVVEGEKDVETLRRFGYLATTSGNAGSWNSRFAPAFAGRDVVILPDNDQPGEKYLQAILTDLPAVAASVKVVRLPVPEAEDVSWFLENGGTIGELDRLIAEAVPLQQPGALVPVYVGRLPRPPRREWILGQWIPAGAISTMFGPGGSFKSWWALTLALAIAQGRSFMGQSTKQGKVLWLDWELDQDEFTRRVRSLHFGLGFDESELPKNQLAYLQPSKSVRDETLQAQIRALVKSYGPLIVFIDSYTAASTGASANSNGNDDVAFVMAIIRSLAPTVFVIDHTGKADMSLEKQLDATALGGVTKWNLSRSVIAAGSENGTMGIRHRKSTFGPLLKDLAFEFSFDFENENGDQPVRVRPADINSPELETLMSSVSAAKRIPELLQSEGPMTLAQLARRIDKAPQTIKNNLGPFLRQKTIAFTPEGTYEYRPVPIIGTARRKQLER